MGDYKKIAILKARSYREPQRRKQRITSYVVHLMLLRNYIKNLAQIILYV